MDRLSLFLLLICLPVWLSAQSLQGRLDSILASPRDTHQLLEFNELLLEMINGGKPVTDSLFEQAMDLARELNDTWTLGILYGNRSVYYLNSGKVEKGLADINEAIRYAQAISEKDLLAQSYGTKMLLLMLGGYTKESAELAAALAKKYHDEGALYYEAGVYQMLSTLSSSLGDYQLTMTYDSIAVERARQSGYVDILSSTLYSASENLNLLGFPQEALVLAEEAMSIAEEHDLDFDLGNARSARAEANTALGNYAEALRDYELLKDWEGEQPYTWLMTSKGILLQRIGRHDEARQLLLEAVRLIKETSNDPLGLKRCYQALQTVGLDQAQYDTVVWYGKLMTAQQDSLQAAENIRNLQELEEKYKTAEKEREIQEQQEQLVRRENQLYASVFGLLLALGAGTVFFLLSWRLRRKNKENEQLLLEKETLMGEVHHRVKNNLQVISSLLRLQGRKLDADDEKAREALQISQARVNAMGLIHKKLYHGKRVTTVHMPDYLNDLGETLVSTYKLEEQVEIFYDVEDISLDVDKAIPLGLIVNELISNSMKYAFPNGREGTIELALNRIGGQLRLAVLDDGVGAAAAKKRADSTSFGNNLIELLTKKLKGTTRRIAGKGYGVEISFAG